MWRIQNNVGSGILSFFWVCGLLGNPCFPCPSKGERMLKRSLDARAEKGSKPSAEEFRLFLTILREQGKLQEALRFPFCDTCLRSDSSKLDAAHSRSAVVAHGSCETDPRAASSAEIDDEQSLKRSGVASEFLMMQPVRRSSGGDQLHSMKRCCCRWSASRLRQGCVVRPRMVKVHVRSTTNLSAFRLTNGEPCWS